MRALASFTKALKIKYRDVEFSIDADSEIGLADSSDLDTDLAELGPGPHRSGDIAHILDRRVTAVSPVRSSLVAKGMIYSPARGDTAFTAPLFDGFMKRIIPQV